MKKALTIVGILALLILCVRLLVAQTFESVQAKCYPASVEWKQDSLPVVSFGCVDFRKDSLIIIPHLVRGEAKMAVVVQKNQVSAVTLLKPSERAEMRR